MKIKALEVHNCANNGSWLHCGEYTMQENVMVFLSTMGIQAILQSLTLHGHRLNFHCIGKNFDFHIEKTH